MSTCYYLACIKCAEYVWIGQENTQGATFYSGLPETMRALGAFLFVHRFHPLEFTNEHDQRTLKDVTKAMMGLPRKEWNWRP